MNSSHDLSKGSYSPLLGTFPISCNHPLYSSLGTVFAQLSGSSGCFLQIAFLAHDGFHVLVDREKTIASHVFHIRTDCTCYTHTRSAKVHSCRS